jgi:anion-transporting  ArsA/GET3 family ATPase
MLFDRHSLVVVVGSGGVGKTTLAAALGVQAADSGLDTLVMTFDPSFRLKDALGVGDAVQDREVRVSLDAPGVLAASLLDARETFDRLVRRYAPDEAAARRILDNRFYQHLAGNLAGILEYMAVERLFEVAAEDRYDLIVLDTPPTRQALDFLQAPDRIVGFLDSGALGLALRPWFDAQGRLKATARLGGLGHRVEVFLDRVIGLDLLREMAEFFQAFAPLYEGFRERATNVQALLGAPETTFVLVAGPGEERIPETLFFARRLGEAGHHLGSLIVNMVHPRGTAPVTDMDEETAAGVRVFAWLGERDAQGLAALDTLLAPSQPLIDLPLLPDEPTDIPALRALGHIVGAKLAGSFREADRHEGRDLRARAR